MEIRSSYRKKDFLHDTIIGAVIALVSVPISMGYAQVAGLPAIYGLYGSLLPVALFALTSSSPRFVFGVDAAPAALTGGILLSLKIPFESPQATSTVPFISLLVSFWLFIFFIIKADRILKYISDSVMGGFITGIGIEIILMQLPKTFGGNGASGEIAELIVNIIEQAQKNFNFPSLILSAISLAILLTSKKCIPSFPIQPLVMLGGASLAYFVNLGDFGIKTLPPVSLALPLNTNLPGLYQTARLLGPSLSIALLILSESLLASSNISLKRGDKLSTRREILSYSLANFASALSGSCPVNGSISRTGIADQLGVKSRVMLFSSSIFMGLILIFASPFIQLLPIPVLTSIVISALLGTFEFSLAKKFKKVDKAEFFIFHAALISVLLLGTIYGVLVGVFLSSLNFIIRQTRPVTDFLGAIPGRMGYYSLNRSDSAAYPIEGTIIYKFSGPLFYATIGIFCKELEENISQEHKIVVFDASGISYIDLTACERLVMLYKKLKGQGKKFYMTGHKAGINRQLQAFGATILIQEGVVCQKLSTALEKAGLAHPFPINKGWERKGPAPEIHKTEEEWALGS